MFIVRLYRARLVTHKPTCPIVAIEPGLCDRINVHARRKLVIGMDRHALQTQFPPSRIELRNAPQFRLPSFHSALIKAGASNPIATIATTINGHSTTNQKEIFESEFLGVGFLFMLFSQAFEDRHFRKFEIFLPMLGAWGEARLLLGAIQVRLRLRFIVVLERTRRGGALSQRFETRIVA